MTLDARDLEATLLGLNGRTIEAINAFQKLWPDLKWVRGAGHPTERSARQKLDILRTRA